MIVGTEIDNNSIRQSSIEIQRRFDRAGQDAGAGFMAQFADGAAANAPKVQKAVDRAADATGRLRVEQEKLDALISSGDAKRERVVAQSEKVAKARRDEARAYQDATTAAREYDQVGQQAGDSFTAGLHGASAGAAAAGGGFADSFAGGFAGASSLSGLGGVVLRGGGWATAAAAVGTMFGSAIADGLANIEMQDQFQARMGLDDAVMASYGDAAGRAYANNFGLSLQDNLATAQAALRSGLLDPAATDAQVQAVVEQLQGVASVTEATTAELSRSITTLMRTGMSGSVSEASDIITAGFQAGLDVSGDWLDTINEYSTQFRKFGLNAGQVLTLLNQGLAGGARDTDKVADALKEFSIRAVDGSKSTAEGFAALGFSAEDMSRRFAAGGQSAQVALDATFDALRRIDDPMQQALIWQRLFGTQFEDMGDAINRFDLDPAKNEFRDIAGVSRDATRTATDNWVAEWDTAMRAAQMRWSDFSTWLADELTDLPVIRDIPEIVKALVSAPGADRPTGPSGPMPLDYAPTSPLPDPRVLPSGPGLGPYPTSSALDEYFDAFTPAAPAPVAPAGPETQWDWRSGGPVPAGPGPDPAQGGVTPGTPVPIVADSVDSGRADKPVIDPSRYSLDRLPITVRPDQIPGIAAPPPMQSPIMQGPTGLGYFEVDQQKVFDAETQLISQRQSVENARLRVLELEADSNATAAERNAARTAVTLAERQYLSQQQKLAEAQQGTWEKLEDTASSFASGMDDIGASLDADFGLSDGIPGFFENLTKAIGNLAAASLLGPLSAIKNAHGDEGSGLFGILASNGAFGPRYMPNNSGTEIPGYPSSLGPAALRPGYPGGYPGDAALLANVPSGEYISEAGVGDLTQGIGDCTSAIEDLIDMMDGRPTGGRTLSTDNAAEWLTARGFRPGYQPGAFNVGFNSDHAQATLPGGTPFNWGSPEAAANRGIGGGGALDPSFTSHYYRPVAPSLPTLAPSGPMPAPSYPMPDLLSPANTNPALTDPLPPLPAPGSVPSSGGMFPGQGMPQAAPFLPPPGAAGGQIAPSLMPGQAPSAVPGAGAGMTGAVSGLPLAGLQAAASSLDLMAPGAGAAANLGLQLGNRTIGFVGQQVGNFWSGLAETISVSGSKGGGSDFTKSLPGRLLAGIAGARPSVPTTAGGGVQQRQNDPRQQQNPQQDQYHGPLVEIHGGLHQAPGQDPDSVTNSMVNQIRSAQYAAGWQNARGI